MQLSIVIVNYNVRDLLLNAIASLYVAIEGIDAEVIVVDNASTDGAIEAIAEAFPDVRTFPLDRNLGFGAANNIGIRAARGEYILLINPDTIVQERTLRTMMEFMEAHPDAGIAGCKILNPDGSYEPASKRGFPSPWSSFCRVFGLSRLFPKSKLFGGYNLNHLDPESTSSIDAISGCFMFCRAGVLHDLGGFDTDFFMYGEDLDICFRAKRLGWNIYYYPATSIMHLKGESTRRSALDALAVFYEAMEIFAEKHFRRNRPLLWMIRVGIRLRRGMARVYDRLPMWWFIPIDVVTVLLGLILGTVIKVGAPLAYPAWAVPAVIIVPPLVFVFSIATAGGYGSDERAPQHALFGYLLGFFALSALTFFFKDYAFSRGVVLLTTGIATAVGVALRFVWLLYKRTFGSESTRRIAFLTRDEVSPKLRHAVRWMVFGKPVTIIGTIAPTFVEVDPAETTMLGTVENISKIVRNHRLTDIFVLDPKLSYEQVLEAMVHTSNQSVRFHITRSSLEPLEGLVDLTSAAASPLYGPRMKGTHHLSKKLRDRALAFCILVLALPGVYLTGRAPALRFRELWDVVTGRRPLVGGGPAGTVTTGEPVFSVAAICGDDSLSQRELAKVETYYATNQSLLLDCEILIAGLRLRSQPAERLKAREGILRQEAR
jgi:GT2 family glycosyltransferase